VGSQRRILAELESKGITGEDATEGLAAIETLTAVGDSFSDALYTWTDVNDSAQAVELMEATLLEAKSAVAVLTKLINNSQA
jgi:hypothetical protein